MTPHDSKSANAAGRSACRLQGARRRLRAAALASCLWLASSVAGQTITSFWATDASANWHLAQNWTPSIVPNNGPATFFNVTVDRPAANPTVTLDPPAVTISNFLNRDTFRLAGFSGISFSVLAVITNDVSGLIRADGIGNIIRPAEFMNDGGMLINNGSSLMIAPLGGSNPPPSVTHHGTITINPGGVLTLMGGSFTQQGSSSAILGFGMAPGPLPTLTMDSVQYNYQGGIVDVDVWTLANSALNLTPGMQLQVAAGNVMQINNVTMNGMPSPAPSLFNSGFLRAVGAMSTVSAPIALSETGTLGIDTGTTLRSTVAPLLSAGVIQVTTPGEIGLDATWSFGPGVVNTVNNGPIDVIAGDLTISHDQAASQFTNSGAVTIAAVQELTVHNGKFVHSAAAISNAGTIRSENGGIFEIHNSAVTGGGGLTASGATIKILDNSTVTAAAPINIISTPSVQSVLQVMNGSTLNATAGAPITIASAFTTDGSTVVCDVPICVISGTVGSPSNMSISNGSSFTLTATGRIDCGGALAVADSVLIGDGDVNIQTSNPEGVQSGSLTCTGATASILAGSLTVEPGTAITISNMASAGSKKHFLFGLLNESSWSWSSNSQMRLTGGVNAGGIGPLSYARLEVGGADLGFNAATHTGNPAGFVSNFDLPRLSIGPGAHVTLVNCFNNGNANAAPEALYVSTLRFEDATGRLNLNGVHLYYTTLIGNLAQIEDLPSGIPGPVDCDTDLADYAGFQNCFGHSSPYSVPCGSYDLDANLTVQNADYALFQPTWSGPK